MKKYKTKFQVSVVGGFIFLFYAPSAKMARFHTEMCGYNVLSVKRY